VDSPPSDLAKAGIVDSMHVMSNAANRLVVSVQLKIRHQRDTAIAREIQACIDDLLRDFARLRELLWSLQHGTNGAEGAIR
jgi:hypothetical protein